MDANQLPSPDKAFDTLVDNVHSRVFFNKLASQGISPQNAEEAQSLLKLAGTLRVAADDPQIKAASASDRFAGAVNDLNDVLAANGLDGNVKSAAHREHEIAVNNAARQLAAVPEIYSSVLSLKLAETAELAQAKA